MQSSGQQPWIKSIAQVGKNDLVPASLTSFWVLLTRPVRPVFWPKHLIDILCAWTKTRPQLLTTATFLIRFTDSTLDMSSSADLPLLQLPLFSALRSTWLRLPKLRSLSDRNPLIPGPARMATFNLSSRTIYILLLYLQLSIN